MNPTKRAYLELHIAVILYGFTAILGDLIDLPALLIVWWRVLLASFSFFVLIKNKKAISKMPRKLVLSYMGIGVLVGLHWICFYGSIKLANASVALVCMATTSLFTSFFEPFIMKKKLAPLEIFLGLLVIPAMMLIVNNLRADMIIGVWVGLLSAALAAMFASLNKKYIEESDPITISFLELGAAWLFLSIIMPFFFSHNPAASFWPPTVLDWIYMLVLVLLCTTLAYLLSLKVLKYISAFASNLVINLEPVYGIVLAIVILQEHKELNGNFYLGVLMILSIVLAYPILKKRFNAAAR